MTIYQEEMQRRAEKRDCYCYPSAISGDLQICYKGRRVGEVSSEGNMRYPKPSDEATKVLIDQLSGQIRQFTEPCYITQLSIA